MIMFAGGGGPIDTTKTLVSKLVGFETGFETGLGSSQLLANLVGF